MYFGISRRHLLQGGAALTLGTAFGARSAAAAETTIGFIYVGSRDDYGYNQAHAQGAAALKKMPGLKVVEEEKVAETDAVEKTMESMINLDGATLLFPTSFGYYNPHMILSGSPWLGVLAAGITGALHAGICSLPRVNDIAVGIASMLFGTGLAFYLGKPLIEPTAPRLPAIDFGWWSDVPQVRAALRINVLFLIGVAIAPILYWAFRTTRWGLLIRTAGESSDAARAMGYSVLAIRLRATMVGGFLAGIGGSFLSLFYLGSWNEGLSSGQGITAVALVICRWASLAFGGAAALGPALQSVGVTSSYHLFNAAPYILTLAIMIITCSPKRTLTGAPVELSITR